MAIRKFTTSTYFSLLFLLSVLFTACESESTPDFNADFSYEFIDENNVRFTNNSDGEYYSVTWDFGNGEEETTTDRNETFDVYYPVADDYTISLKVLNFTGDTKDASQTITISKTDFEVSFSATVDAANPNYINLENTSKGAFDSFKWLFRDKEIENVTNARAYFPFQGNFVVTLELEKDGETFTDTKTVTITRDDPNYIADFTLVWSDEFDGDRVNTADWTFETGSNGWGNQELQNYTSGDNVDVTDGKLIITARKIDDNTAVGSYTSTRMITKGKQEFTYGKMEIRAKLPSGRGVWPAIWMLGGDISQVGWPACGEIDIMEYVGYQPNVVHATVHTPSGFGGNGNGSSMALETAEEEFHIYGIIWTEKEIKFYVDTPDNLIHTYNPPNKNADTWPFNKPHFFIFNIAVGGTWGGLQGIDNAIFPQTMEIDYVRVYQFDE